MKRFSLALRRIIAVFFIAMSFAGLIHGQQSLVPEKFATLDDLADLSLFNRKLDEVVVEMMKRPGSTRTFVALTGKDSGALIERLKAIRGLRKENPALKDRISYTQPGVRYEPSWKETEFWLVPDKSRAPYVARIYDCECPALEIRGKPMAEKKTNVLVYSTSYPSQTWLDEPIAFFWTVKGGRIVSGQGTQSIAVKMDSKETLAIEVELKVLGWEEDCPSCLDHTSFTTTVLEKLPKEY